MNFYPYYSLIRPGDVIGPDGRPVQGGTTLMPGGGAVDATGRPIHGGGQVLRYFSLNLVRKNMLTLFICQLDQET